MTQKLLNPFKRLNDYLSKIRENQEIEQFMDDQLTNPALLDNFEHEKSDNGETSRLRAANARFIRQFMAKSIDGIL